MILGYMLLDDGGTPLLISESIQVLGDKDVLFAGAVTAITQMLQETLKEKIKYFVAGKYHVYFGYSHRMVLMIISDEKNDRIIDLVDRILDLIQEENISLDQLTFDVEAKNRLAQKIENIIHSHSLSISTIRTIADKIIAFLDSIKGGEELKLHPAEPKSFEKSETFPVETGDGIDIDTLIRKYYEGDMNYVIRHAPKLFASSEFAKILYVKSVLFANSLGSRLSSDIVGNAYAVAISIRDDIARSILLAELECFVDVGGCAKWMKIIEENIDALRQKISSSSETEKNTYLILILPPPRKLASILRSYVNRKDRLAYSCIDALSIFEDALGRIPQNLSSWSEFMGRAKYEFESMPEDMLDAKYQYFFLVLFMTFWGLFSGDVSFKEAVGMLKQSLESYEKQQKIIGKLADRISSNTLALNYQIFFGFLLGLLLDALPSREARSIASKYRKRIVSIIGWLRETRRKGKIYSHIYYSLASNLLSALSRASHQLDMFYRDIPYCVKELALDELEKLWEVDTYYFIQVYINCLEALGYIAARIPMSMARERILAEIALALEGIYESYSESPLIALLAAYKAMKFYLMANTEKCREHAEKIKEKLSLYNDFLRELAKTYFEGKKEEEEESPISSIF